MTAEEIVEELRQLGQESYKRVLIPHGIREPFFGVKIEDMKARFQKKIRMDYKLALDLYDTGIYDAMYLAGLIADDAKMTKANLKHWVKGAYCGGLARYTVPWVACGSPHGHDIAVEWIESPKELVAVAGWSTVSSLMSTKDDTDLDTTELARLLTRIGKTIHDQPNLVRYVMNGFVIAAGSYVVTLTELALAVADKVGTVHVDMGGTSCEVPTAREYIEKVRTRGTIGKKRKSAKC
jgi:3-methyladenine DNA glycosylase AlkD